MQIVFLRHHLDQLVGHYKCENCTCNRDDDGFGQVADHIEDAGVPALRRCSDIGSNFTHLCIHRIEQPRQVADNTVDQNTLEPFLQPINNQKAAPPFPRRPQLRGRRGGVFQNRLAEQSREQRDKDTANQGNAAARHELFYPQLGVKLCSMAGGGVQKIYMVFFKRTVPAGQVRQ